MIDLEASQLTGLLSGVAVFGGMLHKIIGGHVDRFALLIFRIFMKGILSMSESTQTQASGTNVNPGMTAATKITEGVIAAASAATTVQQAVAGASGLPNEVAAGIDAFLQFGGPIVTAINPAYGELFTGVGEGLQTILAAILKHQQTATPAKTA